jgi:hypothetical protein
MESGDKTRLTPNAANAGGSSGEKSKVCSVCGDKSLGYNFNAVTCESCKAFFRRNALKEKVFKVILDGASEQTVHCCLGDESSKTMWVQ